MQIAGYKVSEASFSLVPECLSLMRTVRKSGVGMTGMGKVTCYYRALWGHRWHHGCLRCKGGGLIMRMIIAQVRPRTLSYAHIPPFPKIKTKKKRARTEITGLQCFLLQLSWFKVSFFWGGGRGRWRQCLEMLKYAVSAKISEITCWIKEELWPACQKTLFIIKAYCRDD